MKYLKKFENHIEYKKKLDTLLQRLDKRFPNYYDETLDEIKEILEIPEVKSNPDKLTYLLGFAIFRNEVDVVRLLLELGVNPNTRGFSGSYPILLICSYESISNETLDTLNLLLKHGVKYKELPVLTHLALNYIKKTLDDTMLASNKMATLENMMRVFIENDADCNIKSTSGKDFFEMLDYHKTRKFKTKLKREFPEEFKNYLLKKNVDKFNI